MKMDRRFFADIPGQLAGLQVIGDGHRGENADDGKRDQLDAGRVDDDEKHHLKGYRFPVSVQGLKILHRFDAQRGGGVSQAEEVGQKVQSYGSHSRMVWRNILEQPG